MITQQLVSGGEVLSTSQDWHDTGLEVIQNSVCIAVVYVRDSVLCIEDNRTGTITRMHLEETTER